MRTALLRLEGPLQAWSSQGKLGIRDTEREPTKSGVLGLIGAALGLDRNDDARLAELAELEMAVRVDREGTLLRDYHTAGGGTFRGGAYFVHGVRDCIPSERHYLQGASFTVALSGPRGQIERIAGALSNPIWPLYLGRRSCTPSAGIFLKTTDEAACDALRHVPSAETEERRFRTVIEASPSEGGEPRYDVPVSFREGARRYRVRYVRTDWIELPAKEDDMGVSS